MGTFANNSEPWQMESSTLRATEPTPCAPGPLFVEFHAPLIVGEVHDPKPAVAFAHPKARTIGFPILSGGSREDALHPGQPLGIFPRYVLLGVLGMTLEVGAVGPERGVYVLMLDTEHTILPVLAALEGVYGNVRHVVVVMEASGQVQCIGSGELYGLEGSWLTADLVTWGHQFAVLGGPILEPLLLAPRVASQPPGAPRGQRRRPRGEKVEEPPSNQPARHPSCGMIALLFLCALDARLILQVAFPFARFQPPPILDVVQIAEVSSEFQASKFFVKGGATCCPHRPL